MSAKWRERVEERNGRQEGSSSVGLLELLCVLDRLPVVLDHQLRTVKEMSPIQQPNVTTVLGY